MRRLAPGRSAAARLALSKLALCRLAQGRSRPSRFSSLKSMLASSWTMWEEYSSGRAICDRQISTLSRSLSVRFDDPPSQFIEPYITQPRALFQCEIRRGEGVVGIYRRRCRGGRRAIVGGGVGVAWVQAVASNTSMVMSKGQVDTVRMLRVIATNPYARQFDARTPRLP